ncbi:MAG: PAS domain-containing protein [Spirochaetia bacterium]|nr:PAS domain-containing protein [Spirochaetia bacterium]
MILDIIPIQMWFLSSVDTYGEVNKYHADFLGKQKQEIEFSRFDEFLPPETACACRLSNQEVFDSKETISSEEWLSDSKGRQCLIKITKTPAFDEKGNIEYVFCFGIDITSQRKAETELYQSEENFRSFVEAIDDIFLVGNTEGSIIYSNPAASAKLGYDPAELKGKTILDLHPGYLQKEAASILSDMFKGSREVCPLPLFGKNKNIIPVETRIWHGTWNSKNCIFGLSKDLGKEQEAMQKFDRLFSSNPSPMAVSRMPELEFIDVNNAFIKLFGYSKDEVIGSTSRELSIFVNKDEHDKLVHMLNEYGQIREVELEVKTKKGEIHYGYFSGEIIESQGIKYYLTVMVDITRLKQTEIDLQRTIEELRNALAEIKSLRGIVPICANCKNIRDDKGYWEQVEAYVGRHTDAIFTHSICPECIKTLYPELNNDEC